MYAHELLGRIKKARQEAVDTITDTYKTELFGLPPSSNGSAKLTGATPPNMELITKLYSNGR
jgi:hypothetical protein